MRKLCASVAFGLLFSVASVGVYACADVITFGSSICALTGSGTTATGVEVCSYKCTSIKAADAPAPVAEGAQ
jgi:hypothetical protein